MVTSNRSVPSLVMERYRELKRAYGFCTSLKKISDRYYVYKVIPRWDSLEKKAKTSTVYLGRITGEGIFIEKEESKQRGGARHAVPVKATERGAAFPKTYPKSQLSKIDKTLLTILSTNARADLSYLGRKLGLKPEETYRRVRQLEVKYGIKYLAEIDTRKLGFLSFFIRANFYERSPTEKEILAATSGEPGVQLVQALSGYGFVIYALAKDNKEIADMKGRIRTALGKYDSKWSTTPAVFHYSFIPLRDEFLESLKGRILKREYAVLKELNRKGTTEFTEIDKRYKFDDGRALYTYHRLKEKGVLMRVTMTMEKLPIKYIGMILETISNYKQFGKTRLRSLMDILKETNSMTNKYVLVTGIESPSGAAFFLPIFREGDLEAASESAAKLKRGIRLKTYVVTNTLVGSMCFRRIDPTNTMLHDRLVKEYGARLPPRNNYDETGRKIKKEKERSTREFDLIELEREQQESVVWE